MSRSACARRLLAGIATISGLLLATSGRATAQAVDDRVVQRLATLGAERDTGSIRRLADSVLSGPASAMAQAEALYWRGMSSTPRGSGRADLLRLILDHPASARAGDAQYALATEDLARGNRAGARTRLTRVIRDHAGSTSAAEAAVRLGQLLLEDGDLVGGCAALDSALSYLPTESVERRNQVNYARRTCERLPEVPGRENAQAGDSSRGSGAGSARDSAAKPTGTAPATASSRANRPPRATPRQASPASAVRWSAQVAAYTDKADADRAAERLTTQGFDVRVTGERPFRVRIGRYAVRSEAVALVGRLKADGTNAILVEAERR